MTWLIPLHSRGPYVSVSDATTWHPRVPGRPSPSGHASRHQTFCGRLLDDDVANSLRLHAIRSTSSPLLPHGLDREWATLGETQDAARRASGRHECRPLHRSLITEPPLVAPGLTLRISACSRNHAGAASRLRDMICLLTALFVPTDSHPRFRSTGIYPVCCGSRSAPRHLEWSNGMRGRLAYTSRTRTMDGASGARTRSPTLRILLTKWNNVHPMFPSAFDATDMC